MTTTPVDRTIEHLPIADLAAHPRNPKAHREELIDESIGRFGVVEPVILDRRTGYIISGHGRVKALTAMEARGESPPDGVRTDPEGRWLIPTVTGWASRTDTEAAAALIALNRTTEVGGWADDALLGLLDELSEVDGGMDGVGYDLDALDDLRAALDANTTVDGETDPYGEGFPSVETDPDLDHECPSCGYEWSGATR